MFRVTTRLTFLSKAVMTSRKEIPSSGTTTCGTWKEGPAADVFRDELAIDGRTFRQHHRSLDDVLELPHVAWPIVLDE